jgi:glycopeptide antibiotics resistance protein
VPPWRDFTLTRSYLSDILINIIGFIPLGFFFSLYLERKGVPSNKILWIVILIGGAVSLSIEIVQIYLPGRSSQLMDVIDNILGSHLGVILFKLAQKIRTLLHPAGANSETH